MTRDDAAGPTTVRSAQAARPPMVKICGIRRVEDAIVAAESGADFLGFVFYARSRRAVEPELAREIIAAAREHGHAWMTGVFVNEHTDVMNDNARIAGLDYVQLSGNEPETILSGLDLPAIQVIHVRAGGRTDELADRIERSAAELVLLDTPSDAFGGTGKSFDWNLLPVIDRPALLAGGLHAGNVTDAICRVTPWGVDVSSGVETLGEKDPAKIRAFIATAKGAEAPHTMESQL